MPLSYQEITDPSSTTFTVSFEFLNLSDIKAVGKLNSASTWTELPVTGAATTSNGVTTVTVADAGTYSSAGAIRLYRASTQNPLVDFQNGSRLSESDLDTAYRQGLFAAQEVRENAGENITTVGPVGPAGTAGADGADGADAVITAGSIANDKLENSSVTINGSAVALGGSTTVGGGKIGQVVFASTSTEVINTSTTYADVGLSASITPTATSSKIYVIVSLSSMGYSGSSANNISGFARLLRGSTEIGVYLNCRVDNVTAMQNGATISANILDSPSTAGSPVTYKVQQKVVTAGNGRAISIGFGSTLSTITLMEVLA